MYQLLILLAALAAFSATYTVAPYECKALTQDIGFVPDDTTWQLKTVIDSYHIGGQTWDRTYWGTTKHDIRFYYWCGGATTWCYKTVHDFTNSTVHPLGNANNSNVWNINGTVYIWVVYPASTDLLTNTDTTWHSTTLNVVTSQAIAGNQGMFLKLNGSRDSIFSYDSAGILTYQTQGNSIVKDLQDNLQIAYLSNIYAYEEGSWIPIHSFSIFSKLYYSPEDTNYFHTPFLNNGIDTLVWSSDDSRRSTTNFYAFPNHNFYEPYRKALYYYGWSNKRVYTYAFPESATTDIYMASIEKVYYGRNNINKVLYLNYKPEFTASFIPDSCIVSEAYVCSLYVSDKNSHDFFFFNKLSGPDWLDFANPSDNWMSGIPTDTGTYTVTVRVHDSCSTIPTMDDTLSWTIYAKKLETKAEVAKLIAPQIRMFPNPCTRSTKLMFSGLAPNSKITICNIRGEIVKKVFNSEVELKDIACGLYICKISAKQHSQYLTFTLMK